MYHGKPRNKKKSRKLRKEDIYDTFDLCREIPGAKGERNELLADNEHDNTYDKKTTRNATSPAGIKIKNCAGKERSPPRRKKFLSLQKILSDLGSDLAFVCDIIGSDCAAISLKECSEGGLRGNK